MKWRVRAHTATGSKFSRHVPSLEEGLARAREATKLWLKANPQDVIHWTEQPATLPEASGGVGTTEPIGRSSIRLVPFSTTLFNCIVANPVAQVWQCVAREGERKTAGRPRKNGSAAQALAPVIHDIGNCAVLLSNMDPLREPDGSVKVFLNWHYAEEAALEAYDLADEEDRFPWEPGHPLVYATPKVDVLFDPEGSGTSTEPFILWLTHLSSPRPVWANKTKPVKLGRARKIDSASNPQAAIDQAAHRRRQRELHREPSFEERAQTYRTIRSAIEAAHYWDDYMSGKISL